MFVPFVDPENRRQLSPRRRRTQPPRQPPAFFITTATHAVCTPTDILNARAWRDDALSDRSQGFPHLWRPAALQGRRPCVLPVAVASYRCCGTGCKIEELAQGSCLVCHPPSSPPATGIDQPSWPFRRILAKCETSPASSRARSPTSRGRKALFAALYISVVARDSSDIVRDVSNPRISRLSWHGWAIHSRSWQPLPPLMF